MASVKVSRLTGVTLICSMVPVSFSLTRFSAGRKPQSITSSMIISAGIM